MILTSTEETIITKVETKIKPKTFSISLGKISQLKNKSAKKRIPPILTKPRRITAKDAVRLSIFLLSICCYYITLGVGFQELLRSTHQDFS